VNLYDLVRGIGERLRGERLCPCQECSELRSGRAPLGPAEVYVFCMRCCLAVETRDGRTCGRCGFEVADRAPDHLYHGSD
jgi:hypothetical protein